MALESRLVAQGPRKLLAIDGGGIRGLIALGVLAEIERLLRAQSGADDAFVLADYFDYTAGTSTGALIAASLALGFSVERVQRLYTMHAGAIFHPARLRERLRNRYSSDALAALLQEEYGADTELGSTRLRTLLLLMLRNASTNSPWPVSNNPDALFNQPDLPDCNLRFPLWQLVRASTAAPMFFPPEVIDVGGREHVFVDGGLTPYNNPAFQLFLMATAEPYRLNWPTGEDQLLLVSLGTGLNPRTNAHLSPAQMGVMYNAANVPAALISAAMYQQDLLCRLFGTCLIGDRLDSEVGDMIGIRGPVTPKIFTYLRYDTELSPPSLARLGLGHIPVEQIIRLDAIKHMPAFQAIGTALAKQVRLEHFAGFPPSGSAAARH